MDDIIIRVGKNYRITIPPEVVEALHIKEKDYIMFREVNGVIIIKKVSLE